MYELYKVCIADHQGGGVDLRYRILTTNDRDYAVRQYHEHMAIVEAERDTWTTYELKQAILP